MSETENGPKDDPAVDADRWFRYAEEDLYSARALHADEHAPARDVCLLSQQAAEKALKSVLVREQTEFPHTHDLEAVANLLPEADILADLRPELARLSQWAVEARYPGDLAEADKEEATAVLSTASKTVELISQHFGFDRYVVARPDEQPAS